MCGPQRGPHGRSAAAGQGGFDRRVPAELGDRLNAVTHDDGGGSAAAWFEGEAPSVPLGALGAGRCEHEVRMFNPATRCWRLGPCR